MPVSRGVGFQLTKELAEFATYIEKSGDLRRHHHAFAKVRGFVERITSLWEASNKLGDPAMGIPQITEVYMRTRWMGMSKKHKAEFEKRALAAKVQSTFKMQTPPAAAPVMTEVKA